MLARLLIYGLCAALIVASQANAAPPPVIDVIVLSDGSLRIEGHRYATVSEAQVELSAINKRQPRPEIRFVTVGDINFYAIGKAITLLQATGVPKIGFLIEPAPVQKHR
jgi:biopolymer transport protein ExbD